MARRRIIHRLDYETIRHFTLVSYSVIGAIAFFFAWLLNRPGGIDGEIQYYVFSISGAISFTFAFLKLSLRGYRELLYKLSYAFFSCYVVIQVALVLFVYRSSVDLRIVLAPLTPWISVMFILAFAVFNRKQALRYSVSYYLSLVSLCLLYFVLKPETPRDLKNALLQQIVFSGLVYLLMLFILSTLKDRLFKARLVTHKLERLAFTDKLTKLPNRRALERILYRELARLKRYGTPFAVLLIDLDHFKKVNDTHGHSVGDEVLRSAARTIELTRRETDWCGRWGGEEFAVILAGCNLSDGRQYGERLRRALSEPASSSLPAFTASIGCTSAHESDDLESLFSRVDKALYQAKENGRNQVVAQRFQSAKKSA